MRHLNRSLVAYALTLRHEMNEVLAQSGKAKKGFQRREAEKFESEGKLELYFG